MISEDVLVPEFESDLVADVLQLIGGIREERLPAADLSELFNNGRAARMTLKNEGMTLCGPFKNNENDIHENDTDAGSGSGTIQRGLAGQNLRAAKGTCSVDHILQSRQRGRIVRQALASTASRDLYSRKDRQGKTWAIHSNSRGKSDEGVLHSHEDWTGVVVIMSGSATFVTPGSPSQTTAAKSTSAEGYQLIGGGESHRVGKGDVVIIPPNAPHMYKNIEEPFRYLVIQTP